MSKTARVHSNNQEATKDPDVRWPVRIKLCGGKDFEIPAPKMGFLRHWSTPLVDRARKLMSIAENKDSKAAEMEFLESLTIEDAEARCLCFFDLLEKQGLSREVVEEESDMQEFLAAEREVAQALYPLALQYLGGAG